MRNSQWSKPTAGKLDTRTSVPTSSFRKERQVRDFRKANGLCFYCAEPFDANHRNVCTKRPQQPTQVNALVLNDLDVVLNDDVLNKLAMEDALTKDFCQLSLNALAGTDS